MAKKDLYKFTIQFSEGDPLHQQTAAILNQQGRRKAQFLVNAVMHYLHCKETPDIPQSALVDVDAIEAIVRRIIKEKPLANSSESSMQVKRTVKSEQIDFGDAAELLGKDGLQAIANTMAQFRR